MSIRLYCRKCRIAFDLDAKKCPRCEKIIDSKNKDFRVQVMYNRKSVSKIITGNITFVRELEAKIKTKLIEGTYKDPRKVELKLNDIWAEYLKGYKVRGKAWRREELRYNKTIGLRFGDKTMKSISPFEIEKLMIELKTTETHFHRPYSPKGIKNIIDLLSVLFNYARRIGIYDGENPCSRVTKPKINNEVSNVLPIEKMQELVKYLETYYHRTTAHIIVFLLFTGCRIGEALKLDFADIDFNQRIVRLRDPKNGKDQFIHLNDGALLTLQAQYKNKRPDNDIVFPSDDGGRKNKIGERWASIKNAVGIPLKFRCHDLRHQFASMLASSGEVDQYTLQRLLTHKDFKTTQRYAHLFPQTIRNGAAVIDKILSDNSGENTPKIVKLA